MNKEAFEDTAISAMEDNEQVKERIIDALRKDDRLYVADEKQWVKEAPEQFYDLSVLANIVKDSDLSLNYGYLLYTDESESDEFIEGDSYVDLFNQGDSTYDFLDMYETMLFDNGGSFEDGLKELGLNE